MNDVIRNIANPHAAFGGNRLSGYGFTLSRPPKALRSFSRLRTVMTASDRRIREGQLVSLFQQSWHRESTRQVNPTPTRSDSGLMGYVSAGALPAPRPCSISLPTLLACTMPNRRRIWPLRVELTPHQAHGELAYLIFASPSGFPGERDKALRRGFLPYPA